MLAGGRCSLVQSGFITTVIRVAIKPKPRPDAALNRKRQEERWCGVMARMCVHVSVSESEVVCVCVRME